MTTILDEMRSRFREWAGLHGFDTATSPVDPDRYEDRQTATAWLCFQRGVLFGLARATREEKQEVAP